MFPGFWINSPFRKNKEILLVQGELVTHRLTKPYVSSRQIKKSYGFC